MKRVLIVWAVFSATVVSIEVFVLGQERYNLGYSSLKADKQAPVSALFDTRAGMTLRPSSARVAGWVRIILARPLMASTRRPDLVGPQHASASGTMPRLTGVVSWPGGKFAIFSTAKEPHSVPIKEGDAVGAWIVQSITSGGVVIRSGTVRMLLRPNFASPTPFTIQTPALVAERGRDQSGRHVQSPTYLERQR